MVIRRILDKILGLISTSSCFVLFIIATIIFGIGSPLFAEDGGPETSTGDNNSFVFMIWLISFVASIIALVQAYLFYIWW